LSIKVEALKSKKLIGQVFLERGLIDEEELRTALNLQAESREKLGKLLVDLGYVSERDCLAVVSEHLNIPALSATDYPPVPVLDGVLTFRFMKQCKFVPVALENNVLTLAMTDPLDSATLDSVRQATGYQLRPLLGAESEIMDVLEKFYGSAASTLGRIIEGIDEGDIENLSDEIEDIEQLKDLASEAPVIRLVNLLISKSIESRASDIHIEPFEKDLKVRYRIDGILHDVESPPKKLKAALISRVKIMAKLNIAERRLPQDGRIKLKVLGKDIDLRVSTLPTLYGESVVMRILDKSNTNLYDIRSLGFPEDSLRQFEDLIRRPHGIFLVTGPTGSGKTTTLYSALSAINLPDKKIITIEDPIEYQIDGVNQIHVNPQIGLTFAAGLRHIVRQDPDVIMVGEMRDLETTSIAVQAALTGHLMLSSIHANDTVGVLFRLLDLKIEHFLIASSMIGIVAQRMARRICPDCGRLMEVPQSEQLAYEQVMHEKATELRHGTGCATCAYTGYLGRIGLFETLVINDNIRTLLMKGAAKHEIRAQALKDGLVPMIKDGMMKVKAGITTISEVLQATYTQE